MEVSSVQLSLLFQILNLFVAPRPGSYDSFCVPDDEEIEYEQSQEGNGSSS